MQFHLYQRWAATAFLLGCMAAVTGCLGSTPALGRVSGVVTLDGKPLSSGRVTFWPAAGRSGSGWIETDGRFTLGTFNATDGAVVGSHAVTVTAASKSPPGAPDFDRDRPVSGWPRSPIPARYSNPDSSGLSFEVSPGANRFEIKLVTDE
jgi:hypothetical protein